MATSCSMGSPIPLSDIESVLAWVDTYKLTKPTKKIHRDFSDAVLLAEILSVHYPKLVEMHNYPPRNSQALKLNNWMTLNRKVLKKLKLSLCNNTMEQLANCTPGIIERVLIMVREKVRRDEELNKSTQDGDQNMSSGGSYYEACGDDENVLMVPVKMRVHGVLETVNQKVVSHDLYLSLKEQLKDMQEANELIKQKVEHLDNLLKLKDERITELQKQLERKQSRRKDVEAFQSTVNIPLDLGPPTSAGIKINQRQSCTSVPNDQVKPSLMESRSCKDFHNITHISIVDKQEVMNTDADETMSNIDVDVDRIQSNVFKEIETDVTVQKDITTIEDTIQQEIIELAKPIEEITEPEHCDQNQVLWCKNQKSSL